MKIHPLFLAVATTLVLSSCLQNFKDSELTVINNADTDINFHFNGNVYPLKPGKSTSLSDNNANSGDFRNDLYTYSTIFQHPPYLDELVLSTALKTVESGLTGELDFTNSGRKISIEYVSSFFNKAEFDTTYLNPEKTALRIDTTYSPTYTIGAVSSMGWTD